jgi:uncharacterized protein YigE (DUF2233 family)
MTSRAALAVIALSLASAAAGWSLAASQVIATPVQGLAVRESQLASESATATLTAVVFSEKKYTLRVINSPAPGHTRLADVMRDARALAGVNGGYFQDDLRPVGLLVADGRTIQPFARAKLLAGILTVRPGRIEIVRSANFAAGKNLLDAVQCGPMLVEDSRRVAGLNTERHARRTIVATDGRGQWALCYLTSVSLADSAAILLVPGVFGNWTPRTALNLDGGGSSGLWVNASPAPVSLPEFSFVRDYIGVFVR